MTKTERKRFIKELVSSVQKDLLYESGKYPDSWDGIELRWHIADVFSQVCFGNVGKRKGKRYADYKNTIYTSNLL
jgi:hypothetical protein